MPVFDKNIDEVMHKMITANPFSAMLGMELLEFSEGIAKGRMCFTEDKTNPYGGMHGGCIYALADTITGLAAITYGYYVTTMNGSMNYLRPVKDTRYLYCNASVVHQGSHVGVYRCELFDDSEKLVATAEFNYYRLNKID